MRSNAVGTVTKRGSLWRDLVRLFIREEERFVFQPELSTLAKPRQRQWTTEIESARIQVTIQRFLQTLALLLKKGVALSDSLRRK